MPAKKRKGSEINDRVDRLEARMERMKAGLQRVLELVEGMVNQ